MASLSSLYIKKETLEELLVVLVKKEQRGLDAKGITLTIAHSDQVNEYKQDVAAWVEQTEEARKAKKEKFYVGNGRMYWSDTPKAPEAAPSKGRQQHGEVTPPESSRTEKDDLPF